MIFKANMINEYFPCQLVEHDGSYSIITSEFHYFDDYFGDKEGGGYTVERLAKKLVKENRIKDIRFDSEAGMFCAFSADKEALLRLCDALRRITGDESLYLNLHNTKPLIPLDDAERLLLKGFVVGLDTECQAEFLRNVPLPYLSKKQQEYIDALQNGTDEEKIHAARRINSEARTKVRRWDHYLSHPEIITIFLRAIDKEQNAKVHRELIWALVFICDRHMPDLRCRPYFIDALASKDATTRWLGVWGLWYLVEYPRELVERALSDKSEKVREKANEMLQRESKREFPFWLFNTNLLANE